MGWEKLLQFTEEQNEKRINKGQEWNGIPWFEVHSRYDVVIPAYVDKPLHSIVEEKNPKQTYQRTPMQNILDSEILSSCCFLKFI